jgi:hypothetical protein
MSKRLPSVIALAASLAMATPVVGQSLQVSVSVNGTVYGVSAGGSVPITAAGVGQPAVALVMITGTSQVTSLSIGGTSAITITSSSTLPAATASFTVQYLPTSAASVTGLVSIFTGNSQSPAISFNVIGTTPNLTFSYFISPTGTLANLVSGNQITFPATNVGSSATAVINVVNSGSAPASLPSIALTGSDYQITGSTPTMVLAGQQVSLTVVFTPQTAGTSSGVLTVSLSNASVIFPLSGSGATPNFVAQYTFADNNVHTLFNGSTLSFPAVDINATTNTTIQILNQGTGMGTVSSISVTGTGFQLNGLPSLPSTVAANQSLTFRIVFAPTRTGSYTGTLNINMSGVSISATLTGSAATSNLSVNYIDPNTNNVLPLSNNGALSFPSTVTAGTATITLRVTNTGAGTGTINSITIAGGAASAFQLLNLPALPLAVPPSQQATFGIRFSPAKQQTYTDTLKINLNGQATTISLQGQATQAQYTYTWSNGSNMITISAGGTIPIADTAVGQTSTIVVSVSNSGTADGQISNIGVTGQGLSLSGLPTLPFTLHADGSQHFTLSFAPTQPGAVNGQLIIGDDTFAVTATSLGSRLIYTYTSASSPVPVNDAGVVIFPPLAVGGTESLNFSIQNTGTSAAAISSINLSAPSTVFSLSLLPALPMNLAPGAITTFTVTFVPNNTGNFTGTLQVNTSNFTLSGNGMQPAPLPAYQFQGPSANQQAAQQPAIGLTLASPYPSALQGTLKLTFVPAVFADDSSIQFASGGRTVNFTIPANTTQALFNGNATTVALQTGTTAGNIVITPSFAMQSGFSLTPSSPDLLTLTIQSSAPQLLNASVSSETTTSFTLTLSGYSTSRNIRQFDVQITPKQGQSFSTSHLTIDVSAASASWFQSTVSQSFGGSFLVAIPFTLSSGNTTDDLVHMLQSLSITATNDVGASSVLSVPIP